jgi:hypothetical protein
MNFKVTWKFDHRHLEMEFGQCENSKHHCSGGKTDVKIFSTQLQNFLPNFEFVSKNYDCFTESPLS